MRDARLDVAHCAERRGDVSTRSTRRRAARQRACARAFRTRGGGPALSRPLRTRAHDRRREGDRGDVGSPRARARGLRRAWHQQSPPGRDALRRYEGALRRARDRRHAAGHPEHRVAHASHRRRRRPLAVAGREPSRARGRTFDVHARARQRGRAQDARRGDARRSRPRRIELDPTPLAERRRPRADPASAPDRLLDRADRTSWVP